MISDVRTVHTDGTLPDVIVEPSQLQAPPLFSDSLPPQTLEWHDGGVASRLADRDQGPE
jgi:hypothetical protein